MHNYSLNCIYICIAIYIILRVPHHHRIINHRITGDLINPSLR